MRNLNQSQLKTLSARGGICTGGLEALEAAPLEPAWEPGLGGGIDVRDWMHAELMVEMPPGGRYAEAARGWLDGVMNVVFPDLREGLRANPSTKPVNAVNADQPWASDLPGNSGNNYLSDHIALWNGITEFNASYCGGTCWIQAGLIMGTAGGKYYYGGTGQFEAYFENMGPTYQIVFKTHSEIPISPGSSYEVKVEYDGGVGADNQPQFRTYVNGYYVGAGEIYDSQATAEALAEISSSTSSCPTLTNGSPYQDFGTDASGQYSANYEVYLSTDYPETWNLWSGYPTTEGASGPIYWYEKLNGPAAFRNNGPSGGGA